MKVTSVIITAIVGVASVSAVAAPAPAPSAQDVNAYCNRDANPCGKFKRAAAAIAEAAAAPIAAPEPEAAASHHWCWRQGEPCVAKRDALADLNAKFASKPTDDEILAYCNRDDQPCGIAKRAAKAIAEASAEPEPAPEPEALARHQFCYRPGEACVAKKRDLTNLQSAVAALTATGRDFDFTIDK